jgi:hypothetical protein
MERGLVMAFHSVVIALILYVIMLFVLKQPSQVAEDRSILLGAVILIYMILFGHGLPNAMNKNIM